MTGALAHPRWFLGTVRQISVVTKHLLQDAHVHVSRLDRSKAPGFSLAFESRRPGLKSSLAVQAS